MTKHKMRHPGLFWVLVVLAFVSIMFACAYFLTAWIYQALGWHPAEWVSQIVNSLLGLVLDGVIYGTIATIARSRGWLPEMQIFGPIIQALEDIARGNFDARVENDVQRHQMAGKLADTVNKMAYQLSEMEEMRQEFISNVSHEIQSPLTSIRGFAEALRTNHLSPEESNHYLEIIQAESLRLSRITENLLKLATLESKQGRFEPKTYRLDKQVRNLILACEPQWAGKQIDLEVALDDLTIAADEDLLSQVWTNLVYNAIKFTPEGGKITVSLCRHGDQAQFKIADTGVGIPEADQERVFERFYKVDKSRRRSTEGSGLGLAIVKKIVEIHGGSVAVESREGSGATFTVRLPLSGDRLRSQSFG